MSFNPALLLLILLLANPSCSRSAPATGNPPDSTGNPRDDGPAPTYTYKVVRAFPHDRAAFTQGLVFADGVLYEGTGLYGRSSLRKVDLETGAVLQMHPLDSRYFGEGVTLLDGRLIQLTWQAQVGFVYERESFSLRDQFTYPTEGWGLTHDGERLIMSDGTSVLYFLDARTFAEIAQLQVRDSRDRPVERLNELEYVDGEIYANIWQTDLIARISPRDGRVAGWIDLTGLLETGDRTPPVDVLNGIAYDAAGKRLFVTGKLWPKLFQIELVPRP